MRLRPRAPWWELITVTVVMLSRHELQCPVIVRDAICLRNASRGPSSHYAYPRLMF